MRFERAGRGGHEYVSKYKKEPNFNQNYETDFSVENYYNRWVLLLLTTKNGASDDSFQLKASRRVILIKAGKITYEDYLGLILIAKLLWQKLKYTYTVHGA